jgi:hypothetical protein
MADGEGGVGGEVGEVGVNGRSGEGTVASAAMVVRTVEACRRGGWEEDCFLLPLPQ